jgi:signal recognition particle receptor subunit beta
MTRGKVSTKVIESERGQSIELGKVTTPSNRTMEILGLSTERKFLQMLDQMESKLIGLVILVVANNSSNLGYLGYLINFLKEKLSAPFVIAVYQPLDTTPIPLDFIRSSLNLDEKEQLVNIKLSELDSVTHVLNQLKPPEYMQPHSTQDSQKRVQNQA